MWTRKLFFALALLLGCACSADHDTASNAAVYQAWRERISRTEVTASGSVARVLGIRNGRSGPHEGFLLHLRGAQGHGLTVKVEDNVALTGPIPLQAGDEVEVRGEYIYSEQGGVIHYTHHDPRGRHASGYVRVRGKLYY